MTDTIQSTQRIERTYCLPNGTCVYSDDALRALIQALSADDGVLDVDENTALLNAAGNIDRLAEFLTDAKLKRVRVDTTDHRLAKLHEAMCKLSGTCEPESKAGIFECDGPECRPVCEGPDCTPQGTCSGPNCIPTPANKTGVQLRCEGDDCKTVCEGEGCEAVCEGDDCNAVCVGPDCREGVPVCDGPDCKIICEGDGCQVTCTGPNCDTTCIGPDCVDEAQLAEKQRLADALVAGGADFAENVRAFTEKFPETDLVLFVWGKDCSTCKDVAGPELDAGTVGGKMGQVRKMVVGDGGVFVPFMIRDGDSVAAGWSGLGISPAERSELGLAPFEQLPVIMKIRGGQVTYESTVKPDNWLEVIRQKRAVRSLHSTEN